MLVQKLEITSNGLGISGLLLIAPFLYYLINDQYVVPGIFFALALLMGYAADVCADVAKILRKSGNWKVGYCEGG